jgi:mono/diheme cytochrome c family protein
MNDMSTRRFRLESWRLLLLCAALAAGCNWPGKPREDDRPIPSDKVVKFDVLYRENCAGCHGAEGKLGPAPPLNDPLFLALISDKELEDVVKEGRRVSPTQRTPMPGFAHKKSGPLTEAQIQAIAKGLKENWGAKPPPEAKDAPPYALPKGESGDAKKGEKIFERACSGCHGPNGEGVKGELQINDAAFLALISDQALRRIVVTGRPDLGMPNFAGGESRGSDFKPLTPAEVADVVALLASWREKATGIGK